MAEIAVNWVESIAYCNGVFNQLNNRLEILENSLAELNLCEEFLIIIVLEFLILVRIVLCIIISS